ncbi:MAG TPA: DUF6443 domain-containing protein, partial [Cyclobacteriaceae bacterium]|nr:DUF6443 domain-containing protein [Cyclobacteriaceae bacterium]
MMKNIFAFAFLLACWFSLHAQTKPTISNQSGATEFCQDRFYTFIANPPTDCTFSFWSFSNGQLSYQGSSTQNSPFASIKFPASGTLTANFTCGTATYDINFSAVPSSVTITPSKTNVILLETFSLSATGANYYFWTGDGMISYSGTPVTAAPENGGPDTYTVYGSMVSGSNCSASASTTVTVTKLIDVGPDKSFCRADGNIDLNSWGQSLTTGSWSGPSISNNTILIGQLSDNRYRYVYTRTSDGAQDVLYLSVSGPLAGTASITTASLCGQLTGDLSFSGGLGNLSWQRSHDSGNTWSTISGATSTSYHYSETQETWFRAVTTGPLGGCPDQFSNVVKAVVVPAQSGSISAAADPNSCLTATGNLSLQGYVGAILFWQRSTDNGNTYLTVPNSAGLVSISYNESADTYYKVAVQQGTCQAVFTSPYLVHPIVTAGGNLNSTSSTLDCGNSQANLNLNNYQGDVFTWQASTNDASWFDLQLTGPQNPVSAQTDTWYRVKVERAGFNCPASYSSEFFLQASTHPGTASTTSTEQCGTASGNLTLSNFTGTITQWERSTDNQTWQAVANSAGFPVLQFATSNPVTYYRAAVKFGTSPTCATQYSNVVQVDVSSPTVPGAVTFVGESKEAEVVNGALTFYPTFTLNSYSGLIQNWWEYFYPDVNNGQVINSHANSITVPVITTIEVRAEVKNGNCDALLSGAALMYVNAPFLGDVVDTEGTVLDSYQGYSYKVASAFGISLADGFTFMANSGQDFFIFTDDSYSLPPTDKTFVQEQTILKEGVTDPDKVYFLNAFDRSNTYSYIDGLGRPAQQVQRMASPNQNDIVVPITYDAFGRTDKDYLPFEAQSRSGNFVKNAVSAQAQFYLNPTPKVTASDYPFAAKVYEQSPLSRVTEQGAPGVDWQPVLGHTTKFKYETNIDNEVVLWKMNEATNRPENDGYYAAGTLEVNTAIDEHGSAVKQYKDKNGKLINKKAQNGDALVETVYVYDDANQLRVVMQPEGVANLSGNPDDDFLDKWAFQYRYDEFRRMSQKKVPGAGWVYMVYDNRDRLVMTQDANQRPNNQWMFTKYDDQNRPVMAGIYTFSDPTARVGIASREDIAASISTNNFFEVFDISQTFGYTTYRTFPSDNIEILSVTYYDNYDFISLFGSGFDYDASQLPSTATKTDFVQGQVTGTQTKVRKTNTFLKTVNRYDNKNRIIQSIGSNHLSGFDKTSVVYDFLGRVLTKILVHTKPGDPDITVAEEFTFDHAGRLKAQYHQVGNGPKVNLKSQNYNALGQLVEKNLHLRNDGAYQQSVDYRYNIRGWLTHINNAALADDSGVTNDDGNDYFGFELRYNTPTTNGGAAQFNGNISEVLWSNLVSGRQSYAYSYDPLNRLTQAKYFDTNNPLNNNRFNEQITGYDRNGNIIGTTRQGKTGEVAFSNTYGAMDNLGYSYQGNKLFRVDDSANSTSEEDGFKELNTSSDDYEYDDNGNLTKDKNKGISSMTYNYM